MLREKKEIPKIQEKNQNWPNELYKGKVNALFPFFIQ